MPIPPLGALATSPLSSVDTLLGMATTLWPAIHRLSTLLPLKMQLEAALGRSSGSSSGSSNGGSNISAEAAVLRTELLTSAEAVEATLQQWTPCLPPGCSLDKDDVTRVNVNVEEDGDGAAAVAVAEKGRIHSIFNNALAYRHSALVYLYRSIYGWERSHELVQTHAHLSLTHCVATVSHEGPMGALLWPLFVAGCEATSDDDRELSRRAFAAVDKRQGMKNIERAWDIVREVWRRADLISKEEGGEGEHESATPTAITCSLGVRGGSAKAADLWRRVSKDWGISVIFG